MWNNPNPFGMPYPMYIPMPQQQQAPQSDPIMENIKYLRRLKRIQEGTSKKKEEEKKHPPKSGLSFFDAFCLLTLLGPPVGFAYLFTMILLAKGMIGVISPLLK